MEESGEEAFFPSPLLCGAVWPPPSSGGAAFLPLLWVVLLPQPPLGGAAVPPLLNDR